MFKVMNEFKKNDKPRQNNFSRKTNNYMSNNESTKTTSYNKNNSKETTELNDQGPTFFI